MPTYEYKCQKCFNQFELVQGINEKPADKCPKCGGEVKRMIGSVAGLIFKGKGFYQTDYKGGSSCKKGNDKDSGKGPAASSCGGGCSCCG
ncbi:MAG: zinc ribbon domain-containing protein [Candidatus Omnitrophica bacterium]|nr:zinc ribbon domain-containing protein [Candidatus Omnitrophota bacterium]MDD4013272.1 zinc ribbon domain-containing protein [Candidatus Omnitrophota bacterium]